jgi:hypothetical protein
MSRTLIALCGAALLIAGTSFAEGKHPNLMAAENHLKQAVEKIEAAQKANEFDMEGHAAKAKELLAQAQTELAAAAAAATANKK